MADTTNVLGGGIAFNEVGYDPNGVGPRWDADQDGVLGEGADDEFIEFYNLSGSAINLNGYTLYDSSGALLHTFGATTIAAGGKVVVLDGGTPVNVATYETNNPGVQLELANGTGSFNLNNVSEGFALVDPSNNYITIEYSDGGAALTPTNWATLAGFPGTNLIGSDVITPLTDADGLSLFRQEDGDAT